MIRTVHDDAYFRVEHNASDAIVRIARTARGFEDLQVAERAYAAIDRALSTVPPGSRLLLDVRDAPAPNDPAFEEQVARWRDRIFARFARVAILVRTAVGRLQIQRMSQGAPQPVAVFDDEDRAFDHLLD